MFIGERSASHFRAKCECANGMAREILFYSIGDHMKKKIIATLVVICNVLICCAADPGGTLEKVTPIILSSKIRETDPTIMDVTYIVYSPLSVVNVRALAFEDGERSFLKVVRPETFVKDSSGKDTAQNIGDNIPANVEHTLSWKVSADWATDLAKVKFEILCSDQGKLPLDLITIPPANNNPAITVSYNSQTSDNVFNALMWYYANGEDDLKIENGSLYYGNDVLTSATAVSHMGFAVNYILGKMGYEGLTGVVLNYSASATRKQLAFNTGVHNVVKKNPLMENIYIGEKAYCVIDLSNGATATSYPVSYLDSCPVAGWSEEYKTTKILLRRIEPGTVTVCGTKPVTLTKPFYVGVFEVTQKQYEQVMGKNPSQCKGDTRPVEYVSWNDIRGNSAEHNWPDSKSVAPASFIGILRAKTGLDFDLPTESQWEYACRAGASSDYNNGASTENDLKILGRYGGNISDGRGGYSEHTQVGSYAPNAWGLFDMHGNVAEWCLDWGSSLNGDPASDWRGVSAGSWRVQRGGSWEDNSDLAGASTRHGSAPSSSFFSYGFRLSMTLAE